MSLSNALSGITWIPAKNLIGEIENITLEQLLESLHNYQDIMPGLQSTRLAIWHFLVAVAHRALETHAKNIDLGKVTKENIGPKILEHLKKFESHFELCGPTHYFLQHRDPKLLAKPAAALTVLRIESESGNNGAFFTKCQDEDPQEFELAEVVHLLLEGHCFGSGGLGGGFPGQTISFTDCQYLRPFSVFLKGADLAESLFKNAKKLLNAYDINLMQAQTLVPVWEATDGGASFFESNLELERSHTPAQTLGYQRAFAVEFKKERSRTFAQWVHRAQGVSKWSGEVSLHPCLSKIEIEKDKQKIMIALKPNPNKAIWRDLGPLLLDCIEPDAGKNNDTTRFLVMGVYSDQAKVIGTLGAELEISNKLLRDKNLSGVLKVTLADFESKAQILKFSAKEVVKEIKGRLGKKVELKSFEHILEHSQYIADYWDCLGNDFQTQLLPSINDDPGWCNDVAVATNRAINRAVKRFVADFSNSAERLMAEALMKRRMKLL